MIVIETSALVAVMFEEPDGPALEVVMTSNACAIPASCWLEASMAVRRKPLPVGVFDRYVAMLKPTILLFDERQAQIAIAADRRYGRATGHPARLNFGDCMAYAAAVALDAPLLFKGEDFAQTDVKRVALN